MAEYYAQPVEYPNPPPQPDGRVEPRPEGIPAHAHEGTDVNIRPLLYTGIGLVVFLVATCVFLVFVFDLYSVVERKGVPVPSGVEGVRFERAIAAPPLQGVPGTHSNVPAKDMDEFRAENERLTTTYSTEQNGVARIPVTRAIDLALERKLFKAATGPTTAPAAPADARPTPPAGAAGTGEKSE